MRRRTTPQIQTITQTNDPPSWVENILKKASSEALDLYNKRKGNNIYRGERIADLSDMTKNALIGLQKTADLYNNPTFTKRFNEPTHSSTNLFNMAKGDWIGGNSKFNAALQNALSKTSDSVNQLMSGSGRYGSGTHTKVLADELGALATNAIARQYNEDIKNMMNANQIIDRSLYDQVNAANSYYQGQSNAQSNALKGGMIQDKNQQNILDAKHQQWIEQSNEDWNQLERLLRMGMQAAGNYGVKARESTTTPSVTQNPLRDMQQMMKFMGGFLSLSDVRAKENIIPMGKKNGYPLYEFSYRGDPQRYCGVLAQEVLHLNPSAVYMNAKTTLLHVDYSKIGFKMKKIRVPRNKIFAFFSSFFTCFRFLQKGHIL
ncbi:tail fiber domain-containing protein [Bartonella sp. B10]